MKKIYRPLCRTTLAEFRVDVSARVEFEIVLGSRDRATFWSSPFEPVAGRLLGFELAIASC